MPAFDVDALLLPLDEAAPCGPPDMEYDDEAFQLLETAARGKPEQQFGDTVIPAEDPDWGEMRRLALALFARTRDLRVSLHLIRASLRLQGLGALSDGLALVTGLLERHWDHVYPQLDATDGDDPTERLNALAPLTDLMSVLADVRAARVPGDRSGVTGRMIELASGKAVAGPDERLPSAAALAPVLLAADAAEPGFTARLAGLPAQVAQLDALLTERVGTASPEFKPLRLLVRAIADVAAGAAASVVAPTEAVAAVPVPAGTWPAAAAAAVGVVVAPGQIASRDDAIRMLERVCEWIERNEPSHPAPLLIKRAQRLMTKNFFEIIRDLAPDGMDSVEKIAGLSFDEATGS
ncbi:type VI secretion system protein TssA [Sphaerotilus sp.]|uniref:type VI secretion system protein TssA n=1 Tax=Sphaerotilus sp. TaxID=2093942 RepID=UPI002ACE78D6|nr:type VI secretion system protein TssA [Sphaerotilus sp.]MDZ7856500.1 type VI secretion system protein TssA [Sphaerotilus sp.]